MPFPAAPPSGQMQHLLKLRYLFILFFSLKKKKTFAFSVSLQEKEYVGFATLPNQVHRKSVKKGFDFTLMVAGEPLEPVGQAVQ